jgi:CDP-diacylglycerol--glycerol-3-phosphate 3-phosphatidyltransferase/cardiolipin synthase
MTLNIPTALTWLRIVVIPMLVCLYLLPPEWLSLEMRNLIATSLFVGAAITDWLDGWLARRLRQTSAFGEFLDPVADKLLVAAALIVLVDIERLSGWIAAVIIGREIAISALREWMARQGRSRSVAVNMLGKVKTAAQMVAIPLLLYYEPIGALPVALLGTVLIIVAALLTLVSMGYYLRLALPQLRGDEVAGDD